MILRMKVLSMAMAGMALVGTSLAQQPAATTTGAAPEPDVHMQTAEPIYGLQMWIDQETGEMRAPTREEAASLRVGVQKTLGSEKTQPQLRTFKNGMLAVDLDASMLEFSVVRVEADGSLTQECVDDPKQAIKFIQAKPITPANQEEE